VVPADLGWTDVGSWNAVWDILDRDADGNARTVRSSFWTAATAW